MNSEVVSDFPKVSVQPDFTAVLIGGGVMYEGPFLSRGLDLTGEQNPNVLWIPSAAGNKKFYDRYENKLAEYFDSKGVKFNILHNYALKSDIQSTDNDIDSSKLPTLSQAEDMIGNADNLVISGGSPVLQERLWRAKLGEASSEEIYESESDNILSLIMEGVLEKGKVVTGQSAGLNIWAEGYHSDFRQYITEVGNPWRYSFVKGLGIITGTVVCPHYNGFATKRVYFDEYGNEYPEKRYRGDSFDNLMRKRKDFRELGIGVDNNAALEFTPGTEGANVRAIQGIIPSNPEYLYQDRRGVFLSDFRTEDGSRRKRLIEPTIEPFPFTDLA